ncbi:MAG: CIA30 family protein [Planctomycetota bacterium]
MNPSTLTAAAAFACAAIATPIAAQSFRLDFQDGLGAWSTVLDGVMGGLSSGRIGQPEPGILRFTGELSLENNGGFSQMRTPVREGSCSDADGFVLEVKGDGRSYIFDLRTSNVRMMAGSFQQKFDTRAGEWIQVRLPLADFRLYNFGRAVRSAATLDAAKIESIGVTLADKKAGPFVLDVRSIATYSGDAATVSAVTASSASGGARDLVAVARSAGLNKLLACVTAAGLELPDRPVTIFAPTDAAFAALPKGTVEKLLRPENRQQLRTILMHHVVEGAKGSADVLNQRALASLAGQELAVDLAARTVAGAGLVATDVPFDGGIVHVIDHVLLPETRSIADLAIASENLRTLVAAVKAAGLVDQLGKDNGPWTVFAPVDSAFAKLPKSALEDLLKPQNRGELTRILGLHVVPGRIAARELLQKRTLTTLLGAPIEARLVGGKVTIGGAALVTADVQAHNGVVHLIDSVITKPAGGGDLGTMGATESDEPDANAELRALYDLAVQRGAPLFNRGDVESCAAIYEIAVQSLLRLGRGRLAPELLADLRSDAESAGAIDNPRSRAWAYRRALDEAYRSAGDAAAPVQPGGSKLRPRQ